MIVHDVVQGSQDWLGLRAGRFTATEASAIKTAGQGLETAAVEKAVYRITGVVPETFETPAMRWGKEYEAQAREAYQKTIWQEVKTVGFCELNEYVGCSPDGLVGDDGLCEIKCKQEKGHLLTVIKDEIDPKHYWQMQFQMFVTGRDWCDYVCYNPFFVKPPYVKPLYVKRVERNEKDIAQLAIGLDKGCKLIEQYMQQYKERCI